MLRYRMVMIGLSITIMVLFCACAKPIDGNWANDFNAKSAGFERISIFTDLTVVGLTPRGEEFIWIAESIQTARELDKATAEALLSKGYSIGTRERFFIGDWAEKAFATSFAMSRRTLVKTPPFHIDPGVSRLEELTTDIRVSFEHFGKMIAEGQGALKNGCLPEVAARRIAGNYRSSGFVLILGVVRDIESEKESQTPLNAENMYDYKSPFIAIGYFEGMTGKLVYSNILPLGEKQKGKLLKKNIEQIHMNFPQIRAASRFEVPPPPEYTGDGELIQTIKVIPEYEEEGVVKLNYVAFLTKSGGIPLFDKPDMNYRNEYMIPTGTMVNVIGKKSIFSKVILPDGRVGWVPTDTVWVRK